MAHLIDGDTRAASSFLNYPGTVRPDPHRPMGPNLLHEMVWPVTVEPTMLPPATGKKRRRSGTRVGVSLLPPPGPTE